MVSLLECDLSFGFKKGVLIFRFAFQQREEDQVRKTPPSPPCDVPSSADTFSSLRFLSVHIASGSAALAISIYLGKRKGYGTETLSFRPFNTSYVILGTALLWFGWFGFNGGSGESWIPFFSAAQEERRRS